MIRRSILYISLTFATLTLFSCYVIRAYKFRKLNLLDHEKLPFTEIKAPGHPITYFEASEDSYQNIKSWLNTNLEHTQTAAFLVIKNDTLVYEKYFAPFSNLTLLPSFSVAKSFVSTLAGIALHEGKIVSLSEPITNYIPEFKKKDARFKDITIQHLLDMRSGIKWHEGDYGLKDDAIKMTFRPNMMKQVMKLKIESKPGGEPEYKSINTLLFAIIVERATQTKLPVYLQEKIWQPLGMESQATWNRDKRSLTIAFGALNAVARDFAKLGTLFLKKGNFNGQQIVPESWINASVNKDTMLAYGNYRNQWWGATDYRSFGDSLAAVEYKTTTKNNQPISSYTYKQSNRSWYIKIPSDEFYAEGILGQFVYACPSKKLVMVRLGHDWSHPKYYLTNLFKEIQNRF